MFVFTALLLFACFSCKQEHEDIPVVTTTQVTGITQISAYGGGNIVSDGSSAVVSKGICWSIHDNPDTTANKSFSKSGNFICKLTGLNSNTTYYVRAFATNNSGIGYGKVLIFSTKPGIYAGTVTDIDNNTYNTVKIGNQIWMEENLKTTTFNDGTPIPYVEPDSLWNPFFAAAYGIYADSEKVYKDIYGAIYNWHCVGTNKLCPVGWHVPSDSEWQVLVDYLGGDIEAGGKLKEAGTSHWFSLNTGATNESGFSALPGGWRGDDAAFTKAGAYGYWWSSTRRAEGYPSDNFCWGRFLFHESKRIYRYYDWEGLGFSVRCVKD